MGFGFREDVDLDMDKVGEAKLGADEVRTGRSAWSHQNRKIGLLCY